MPVYSYTHRASGETVERVFPISGIKPRIRVKGRLFVRDVMADHRGAQRVSTGWPMVSTSAGCHPDQIAEFRAFDKQNGVRGCSYTPQGDVEFAGPRERKHWLKAHGQVDRSSYC